MPRDAGRATLTAPRASTRSPRRPVLPRGRVLDDATWRARHRALGAALAAHVPVLFALVGLGRATAVAAAPVALALGLAWAGRSRHVRAGAVVAGLAWCSGVLVVASGGAIVAHIHALVVVLLVALYEDRAAVLLVGVGATLAYVAGWQAAPHALFGAAAAEAGVPLVVLMVVLLAVAAVAAGSWWPADEREPAPMADGAGLQEQERAVAAELEAAAAVKAQLVTVVSHEFRTPLTSITGLARTLSTRLDELDRHTVKACLAGIDHHARRLSCLVHNVLESSGEIDVDRTVVTDLSAVVHEVVADALVAHGNRVRVRMRVPPRLEAAVGPLAARRILANLCDNAVKFAPAGELVELWGSEHDDGIDVVMANAAPTLSEAALERCFEPFVQGDPSDTRTVDGMGLGLHVARRLARAHGGEVSGTLRAGQVLFRLELPRPGRLPVRVVEPAALGVLDGVDAPVH